MTANLPKNYENKLKYARYNTAFFLFFLYFQDIFWLTISRIRAELFDSTYYIAPGEFSIFLLFIFLSLGFALLGLFAGFVARPLPSVNIGRQGILLFITIAIFINAYFFFSAQGNIRYMSGGLTGIAGVLYGIKNAVMLSALVIIIKARENGFFPIPWIITLLISSSLNIDGLASALTLFFFAFLVFNYHIKSIFRLIFITFIAVLLLYIGFSMKFSSMPDYLNQDFFINWVIARFSIQAEQAYLYLTGASIINNDISYLELLVRMISNRIDLVMGINFTIQYPRSVSEALFYDMMHYYGAGSSPGVFLGTILQGPIFSLIVPFVFGFIFIQFFYGLNKRISFVPLCAYSFAFKAIHANFSEYLTIVSPTLLVVILFVIASLLKLKDGTKNDKMSNYLEKKFKINFIKM